MRRARNYAGDAAAASWSSNQAFELAGSAHSRIAASQRLRLIARADRNGIEIERQCRNECGNGSAINFQRRKLPRRVQRIDCVFRRQGIAKTCHVYALRFSQFFFRFFFLLPGVRCMSSGIAIFNYPR